ncbi:hypothetical protein [Hydrogenophaga electricum]|uniref:Uncharacterized protein n=1 Tax=Hydrogenophaga electricum TaxID=1230953 RepID=A0ABQ6C3K4_9BURK|nr:hypothetical protein [Hydrogenophaga electricum]GLS13574.1 hypothetical protein GCM10007935_10040 [Hydrogenophaga electricum]
MHHRDDDSASSSSHISAPHWAAPPTPGADETTLTLHRLVCMAGPVAAGGAVVIELAQRAAIAQAEGDRAPLAAHQLQALHSLLLAALQAQAAAALEAADHLACRQTRL